MTATCRGCGDPLTKQNDSKAHVLPQALGGRLAPNGLLCRRCNGILNDVVDLPLVEAFGAWPTLLDIRRQRGKNPSKMVETRKGYRVRLEPDGSLMRTDVVYTPEAIAGGHKITLGAGDIRTARQLLVLAAKDFPGFDIAKAEKHLKKVGLPSDDELKLELNFSPKATFGAAVTAVWLYLIHKTGQSLIPFDKLLTVVAGMQTHGGTFRYLTDRLPGLVGPEVPLSNKIVARSVPSTGELIVYVEVLGVLKIGGLFAVGPKGQMLQHIYVHDLLNKLDRSSEFSIDAPVFDAQDWRNVGLGPADAEALRDHYRRALNTLAEVYYAGHGKSARMLNFRVQQTGSPIRRHYSQRQTLIGLGLNRIGRIAEVPDTPATWGMIRKVRHLIGFPDEHLYEKHRLVRRGPVNEAADLDLVRRLVFEPRRIRVERINEAEMEGEKSPDFRLFKDGQLQGFCEVKSPRDHWDFEFPKDLKPGEIREQIRRDPAAPNLGLHIVKAAKQFDSVNPDHSVPNILVVVNHATGRNPLDLRFALEGLKVPGGRRGFLIFDEKKQGDKDQEVPDEKQKEVWEAAKSIDLYLWVDPQQKTWVYRFPLGAKRLAEACALIGIYPPPPKVPD